MRAPLAVLLLVATSAAAPPRAQADDACTPVAAGDRVEITLDNGKRLSGKVERLTDRALTLDLAAETGLRGKLEFDRARIAAVKVLKPLSAAEAGKVRTEREAEYAAKVKALLDQAEAASKAGDYAGAAERSRDALRSAPEEAAVRSAASAHFRNCGADCLQNGRFGDGAAVFGELLALEPENPEGRLGLGFCLFKERDFAGAAGHLEKAAEAFPERADIPSALAFSYYWLDDLESAERWIRKARALDPKSADAAAIDKKIAAERSADAESQMVRGETFVIKFKGEAADEAFGREVMEYLEESRDDIAKMLDVRLEGPLRVVLHTDEEFRDALKMPSHVRGFYSLGEKKIHVPAARARTDPAGFRRTLTHELTHAVIDGATTGCPTWLHEAFAQDCARQFDAARAAAARAHFAAVDAQGGLCALSAIEEAFATRRNDAAAFAELYEHAWSVLDYIGGVCGRARFPEILKAMAGGSSAEAALSGVTGKSLDEIDADWRAALKSGGGKAD